MTLDEYYVIRANELIADIRANLPYAEDWLRTPHVFLSGDTPNDAITHGRVETVRGLLNSILYIGVS